MSIDKWLKLLVALLLFANNALAQSDTIPTQGIYFLHSNFTQHKYIRNADIVLMSNGIFIFKKDEFIIWQIQDPIKLTTVIKRNGDVKQYRHHPITNELELGNLPFSKKRFFQVLYSILNSLLSEDDKNNNKDFDVTHRNNSFILSPRNRDLKKRLLEITGHYDNGQLISLIIQHNKVDKTILYFNNFDEGVKNESNWGRFLINE